MNDKYFGNSLDLFKYDVLTYLCNINMVGLFYVPMLTEPEKRKNDPKYSLYEVGSKNNELFELLNEAIIKELDFSFINNYLEMNIPNYKILFDRSYCNSEIISIDEIRYFTQENRSIYFSESLKIFKNWKIKRRIFFIEPDVGIDLGISRRVRSMRKMYLNTEEVLNIRSNIGKNDIICYFQHLGNPRYPLCKRHEDLVDKFGSNILIFSYERISAAMIFIFKDTELLLKFKEDLEKYKINYNEIKHLNKLKLI